ncbi:hypothetical protein [Goodfellowiella coeruleoviolacea]|uniref:PPE family domain-containing protein n=1 Tax=Goodfellowiella coeruleoviolacea TaxID=334858 RepID=A0AAE3KL58_9PSEU|nr:hypothetical protein [Goodfellowiella coeruleoviolacea]MCP2166178.1 hypothetical protein [Goodfellowiella coeruleoviolacea]
MYLSGHPEIRDHRFQGYDNAALADLVDRFGQGSGVEGLERAGDALRNIANSLADTDRVLREQLAAIGVEWESGASDMAQSIMLGSAEYGADADTKVTMSSKSVQQQSAAYSHTKYSLPDSEQLRGDTEKSWVDKGASLFGYTTDHAREVERTKAARQQAIDSLDQYTSASREALHRYQGLEQPPAFDLQVSPAADSTSLSGVHGSTGQVTGVASAGVGGGAGFSGGGAGGSGVAGVPGGGSGSPVPTPGALPGGGGNTGTPGQLPGSYSGTLTPGGGANQAPAAANFGTTAKPTGNFGLGMGFGVAAGAGLGAAAAGARGGQVVGGGRSGRTPGIGGYPNTPEGRAAANRAAGGAAGAMEEEHPLNRNSAQAGRGGKAGSSLMQPAAAAGRGGKPEEDEEHVRKYGIDSDDVFGDGRLVAPSVLGDDDMKDK